MTTLFEQLEQPTTYFKKGALVAIPYSLLSLAMSHDQTAIGVGLFVLTSCMFPPTPTELDSHDKALSYILGSVATAVTTYAINTMLSDESEGLSMTPA